MMKNLTLRIDERKLNKARRIAAERTTSVNAMIREFLDQLIKEEAGQAQAREELIQLCEESKAQIGQAK